MREYPDNHGGLLDGSDDLQVAATLRAMLDINVENALEQARPAHARRCACVLLGVFTRLPRRARHDEIKKVSISGYRQLRAGIRHK